VLSSAEREELARLRRENRRLQMERATSWQRVTRSSRQSGGLSTRGTPGSPPTAKSDKTFTPATGA
jgi:hypothetical protein